MTHKQKIKNRLDTIAKKINELHKLIREEHPSGYVYVEADGSVHAMSRFVDSSATLSERQVVVIASSETAQYDCGAW